MSKNLKSLSVSLIAFLLVFSVSFQVLAADYCVSGTGSAGADGTYTDTTHDAGATYTAVKGGYHLNDDGSQCYIMYGPYFGWTVGFYATTMGSCGGNFASASSWQAYDSWISYPTPTITAGSCSTPPPPSPPITLTSSIAAIFTIASSTCVQTNFDHTATSTYTCWATSTQPVGVPYGDWIILSSIMIFCVAFIPVGTLYSIIQKRK